MHRPSRRVTAAGVVIAVLGIACRQSAATDPVPTPSVGAPATPRPSISVSPSASTAIATASPMATPESWYPWLPPIDERIDAAFAVDSFVTARTNVVPISGFPGGPPFRFDNGDPDTATHPLIGFPQGSVLVVVHGPVLVDDRHWYYLTTAHISIDIPSGWSPVISPEGSRYLRATTYECPTDPVDTRTLTDGLTDGLPACFGDKEVTITGDLRCDRGPDTIAHGASWLAGGSCRFDSPPTVYGLDPSLAPGRYAVTGRFLDDESRSCRWTDGDDSTDGLVAAVLYCRRAFVATSATRV